MENEVVIESLTWMGPEYTHKERSIDSLWTIGLGTLVAAGIAVWIGNYLFAIFIVISGACLVLLSIRPPQMLTFSIESEGLSFGKDKHPWKNVIEFDIHKGEPYAKLLVHTNRYFLPLLTIPVPTEMLPNVKQELLKIVPQTELQESHSMRVMERLGF